MARTVICATRRRLGLSSSLWQELFEVFEKVWGRVEQCGDLSVDVLDGLLLSLICLKDFKKLLVNLWFVLEAILGLYQ